MEDHTSRAGCDDCNITDFFLIISIHTSREGCDHIGFYMKKEIQISIHTSRARCDGEFILKTVFNFTFQFTHPVRDVIAFDVWLRGDLFQFTHPVRDMMRASLSYTEDIHHFNSHIPCGM